MDRKRLLRNPLIWILAAILVYFTFSVLFDDTRGYTQVPTSVALTQIDAEEVAGRRVAGSLVTGHGVADGCGSPSENVIRSARVGTLVTQSGQRVISTSP